MSTTTMATTAPASTTTHKAAVHTFGEPPFHGRLHVTCMPGSLVFDGNDEVIHRYEAWHNDEGAGQLFVAQMVPDDEALRQRSDQRPPLRTDYARRGFEVHQPIIDGFEETSRVALNAAVDAAVEAHTNGRHVTSHCHSGMGRGGVFAVLVAARLQHGAEPTAAQRRDTLEYVQAKVCSELLRKENPQRYYLQA
eukprot:TRINITY_DN6016_c0_g1_i1.p1 TRINITY_DN6016_c0_g1~~TRINITY_DN6016_c0_g1_i1.p1  ORF type:complete len:194 (-),score=43.38 TRINITY_DN6016_c0_g1_i1:329-910(-)